MYVLHVVSMVHIGSVAYEGLVFTLMTGGKTTKYGVLHCRLSKQIPFGLLICVSHLFKQNVKHWKPSFKDNIDKNHWYISNLMINTMNVMIEWKNTNKSISWLYRCHFTLLLFYLLHTHFSAYSKNKKYSPAAKSYWDKKVISSQRNMMIQLTTFSFVHFLICVKNSLPSSKASHCWAAYP